MTASGLSDEDIVRIARQIRVVRNLVQFSDTAVVDGYDMISTMQPWTVIQGIPVEQIFYSRRQRRPARRVRHHRLATAPRQPGRQ